MPEFRVIYEIDIEAPDAMTAARECWATMRDFESHGPNLTVIEIQGHELTTNTPIMGKSVEIELYDEPFDPEPAPFWTLPDSQKAEGLGE